MSKYKEEDLSRIRPISIEQSFVSRELPMMLFVTLTCLIMGFDIALGRGPNIYSRGEGLVLLVFFVIFIVYTVGDFVRQRGRDDAMTLVEGDPHASVKRSFVLTILGLVALVGGAEVTVEAAVSIAKAAGVPEVIIGLTVLAVGTSLPELVASMSAVAKGHVALAIGNVVGSNIFNLTLVLGVTNTIRPTPVPEGGHEDLFIVMLLSLVLYFVSVTRMRQIIRTEASLLLLIYVAYIAIRASGALI